MKLLMITLFSFLLHSAFAQQAFNVEAEKATIKEVVSSCIGWAKEKKS